MNFWKHSFKSPAAMLVRMAGFVFFLHGNLAHAAMDVSYDKAGNRVSIASLPSAPPSIVSHPDACFGVASGTASFSVIATGTGPLTYQWQRNNVDIPSAIASTLFLDNLVAGDFAAYKVVVTNGSGSATSNEVQLILDADEDSLPDDWEITYFGNITAQTSGGDGDGDSVTNIDEYKDGTLPNSAASRYFKLTVSGNGVVVSPAQVRYAPGSLVTLNAQDQGVPEFTGWTGNATGAANPLQVTMNADKAIRATRSALPLDSSFAPIITSAAGSVRAMVRLPDGKFLVAGNFDAISGIPCMNVARLNADWSVDTTFQGPIFNRTAASLQDVLAMVVQSDGKIIIAGNFDFLNGTASPPIARLLSNGSVDPTFVSPSIVGGSAIVESLATQADDKILLSGFFYTVAGNARLHVARLMADGTVDAAFNTSVGPNQIVHKVVWQGPGKILIGGDFTQVGSTARNRIARLTDTGAIDVTFDPGTGFNNDVEAMKLDSAGRILVGGGFDTFNGSAAPALVRLFDTGARDTTFSVARANWHIEGPVNDIIEQPDGKIIAGFCYTWQTSPTYFEPPTGPVRFTSTGEWDLTFAPAIYDVYCMLQDGNGDLRFGGEFFSINGVPQHNLGRLTASNAVPSTPIPPSATRAAAARFLPYTDGRTLVFGEFALINGVPRNGVGRLLPDGSIDLGYDPGSGGYSDPPYFNRNRFRCAAIQGDGKVLLGSRYYVDGIGKSLVRVNLDGSLDSGFTAPTAIPASSFDTVFDLAVQSDGKIVVGGFFTSTTPPLQNLARLQVNGTLDNTFPAVADGEVFSVDIANDDRLLIGGAFSNVNGVARRRVANLTAAGQLDGSFSTGAEPSSSTAIVYQASFIDGLVAMTGPFSYAGPTRAGVAVLSPSGALAPNRNTGGLLTAFTSPYESCLSPRSDGGLWVGGAFTAVDGVSRKYLAPFLPSGMVDAATLNDLQVPNGPVYAVHEASNGDLLVSGPFTQAGGIDRFGLARYVTTNRVTMGALTTTPSGPQFPSGSNIEMTVSAEAVSGAVVGVEMEYSADGRRFTYLSDGLPIAPHLWQATASITGPGVFYLRATAIDTNGSRRSSYARGPFESVTTPVISSAAITGLVSQPLSYTVTASGAPLTNFTATNLPPWATFIFQPATHNGLLSGTPNAPGETTVSLTATNAEGSGQGSVKVQIFETYDQWKAAQFSPAEQSDPRSARDADFDGDGLSNFVEFGLCSLPKTPDLASKPQVSLVTIGQSQYLTLTYRRYKWAGATFTIQVSGDLQAWSSGASATTEVSRTDHGDGTETVVTRDNTPVSPTARRMMRLRLQ